MGSPSRVKRDLASAVKLVAAGVDRLRPAGDGLVVLIYHRVGARSTSNVDLPTAMFERQVAELAESGRLVSLESGLARLASGDLEGSPVVITFDDGTSDWIEEVAPVLVRHEAPATFYVASGFVDARRAFPDGGQPISWAGLRDLCATGFATVGSHTHDHLLLDRTGLSAVSADLDRSVDRICSELGITCDHFAYPKALLGTPEAEGEVRRRFGSAVLSGCRRNPVGQDVHRLHRSPIQRTDGMHWFRRKAAGGLRLEDDARHLVNRRRYAGRST